MSEVEKGITELNRNFRVLTSDSSLIFLLKQHTRTQYMAYAFMQVFESEVSGNSHSSESIQTIIINALNYIKQNFKIFSDIIQKPSNNKKAPKKELNANPFGVSGLTSRNINNKENYDTHGNTQSQISSNSKSENKMFIKQNNQIALAFMKKICRVSKNSGEKYKELI